MQRGSLLIWFDPQTIWLAEPRGKRGRSATCRRPSGLNVAIPCRPSTAALHLLIDSTGIKAEGEGEWFAKKHGPSKPRQWRKVHLWDRCRHAGDQGDRDHRQPGRGRADGAYDTRACHAAIAARSASAVIPARKKARPWLENTPGEWMRCFKLPGARVRARDFDRQGAELQIRAFAGSLGPVAFTRSPHEPLHGPRSTANSTRGVSLFKGRGNSTSG